MTTLTELAGHISTRLRPDTVRDHASLDTHPGRQVDTCWHLGTAPSSALVGGDARSMLTQTTASTRLTLDAALHAAFASGLDLAFLVAGGSAVVGGALIAWLLRPHHDLGTNSAEATPTHAAAMSDAATHDT